jgi:chromosome segregation ATPase
MSNNRRWLLIAEYVSITGSVIGSVFAAVSKQSIYGLAPVSVSLFLNLINRRRLEQLSQQNPAASTQIQQLRSTVNSLSVANVKLKQDVQNLVPRQELASIVSVVEHLNQQHNSLRLSLVAIQSRLDDLIAQFNKRPELEQIESLTAVITALKQSLDRLPQPHRLQQQSAELQQQVEMALAQLSDKITDLSNNSERVNHLENALAQVQQQLVNLQ